MSVYEHAWNKGKKKKASAKKQETKNPTGKLKLKNTMTTKKSTADGLSSRLGGTEERLGELTDLTTETRQYKPERNTRQRNRAAGTCGTTTKDATLASTES